MFIKIYQFAKIPTDQVEYSGFVSAAARLAEQSIREDFATYWTLIGGGGAALIALVAFFGFSQFRNIRENVSEQVLRDMRASVLRSGDFKKDIQEGLQEELLGEMRREIAGLKNQLAFLSLKERAAKVVSGKGFDDETRDSLYEDIIRLGEMPAIAADVEFRLVLENIVDSFSMAGLFHMVDRLEERLPKFCRSYHGIAASIFQGYAIRLLGEAAEDPTLDLRAKFFEYADICRDLKYPEMALPAVLTFEYWEKDDGYVHRIRNLIEDIEFYKPQEKSAVISIFEQSINMPVANSSTKRMAEKYEAAWKAYEDQIRKAAGPVNPDIAKYIETIGV